jgi:glycosyltransferase involved in cell wall biosynthesis
MRVSNLPRFSVIIPAYNSASTLPRAIESVLTQSVEVHELIVVDDASTDGTPALMASYGNPVRYFRRERNAGVSAARNYGAEQATGDWLAFLDADDWYFERRIAAHASWISEDAGLDFLTGDYEYRGAGGEGLGRSMDQRESGRRMLERAGRNGRVVMEPDDFECFVADHFGDTHTLSVPRTTFLELGGYPLGFKVCEDVHFLTRLVARSRRVGVTCEPLAVYLVHGESATRRDPVQAQRENVRTLIDLRGRSTGFSPPIRRGVKTRIRNGRLNLAYALCKRGDRWPALLSVLPSLLETPGVASLRNVASILKG